MFAVYQTPTKMNTSSLSKNLTYHRKLKGMSQEKLSEHSGVTVRTIQRIEGGEVNSHMHTLKLLAEALEIGVQELLPLENPKEEAIQKKWLLLLHSTPLLGAILPLANILVPVFIWIHKREDNLIYDQQGRAVINFQITITLLFVLSLLSLVLMPFIRHGFGAGSLFSILVVYFGVLLLNIICIVANTFTVLSSGKYYYPFSIPFFRKRQAVKA